MERLLSLLPVNLDYAFLLLLRTSGLIFSSPIFGRQSIPRLSKVAFCIAVTGALLTGLSTTEPVPANGIFSYMLLCITELIFGVVLGYVTTLFFSLTFTAGHIIDTQMGFGMVNVYDPQSGAQVPVTGNLFNIVMLIVFFAVNGHHRLLYLLYKTIENIPIGQVVLSKQMAIASIEAFTSAFLLSIHVAMPFIASGLLAEAAMGVIIKSVPQMNMFVVGMPLKVLIGFMMLIIVIPAFVHYMPTVFDTMFLSLENMFAGMMEAA